MDFIDTWSIEFFSPVGLPAGLSAPFTWLLPLFLILLLIFIVFLYLNEKRLARHLSQVNKGLKDEIETIRDFRPVVASLEQDRNTLRQILASVPQSIFWKDRNSIYLGCNDHFARQVGLNSPKEIVGKSDFDLPWPREEAEAYLADDREVILNNHIKRHIIEPLQQSDGSRIWIDTTKIPLADEQGVVYGVLGVYEDITERKRIEEDLLESQQRLQDLINAAPYGAHTYQLYPDHRMVFIHANQSANAILGVDHQIFVGKTIEEAFPALAATEVPSAYRQVAQTGEVYYQEQITYDEQGISGAYEVHGIQISPNRMTAFFRDITERKKAEEALKTSLRQLQGANQRLQFHIDRMPLAYIVRNRDFIITEWNPAAEKIFGWTAAEAINQDPFKLFNPPEMRPTVEKIWADILSGNNQFTYTVNKNVTKDGRYIICEWYNTPLRDHEGNIIGSLSMVNDITERERAKESLRKTEAQHRDLLEKLPVGVIVHAPDTQIIFSNPRACDLLGLSADQMLGKKAGDTVWKFLRENGTLMPPYDYPVNLVLSSRTTFRESVIGVNHLMTGERLWLLASAFPVFDSTQELAQVVVSIVDITQRKHFEDEIHLLNQDLERRVAERTAQLENVNKELEAFAYSVSHDLRAPLRSMNGFSKILLEDYGPDLDEQALDYLKRIGSASERMGEIIDSLLNLSRITRVPLQVIPVDLSRIVHEIYAEIKSTQPDRDVRCIVHQPLNAEADPNLMKIVFSNLLENSFKFTSRHASAKIEVGSLEQKEQTVFYVRDDGAGFDMEYVDKLFGTFQRLHSPGDFEGTGIGLALVQRIIHRHGGRIWAEAAVEQGATFYFTLGEGRSAP